MRQDLKVTIFRLWRRSINGTRFEFDGLGVRLELGRTKGRDLAIRGVLRLILNGFHSEDQLENWIVIGKG